MQGKYSSSVHFQIARWSRGLLRVLLRPLVSWREQESVEPGYSVIIGALGEMPEVVQGNLRLLRRQQRDHLREIILVFDRPRDRAPFDVVHDLSRQFADLPLRVVFYSPVQMHLLRAIGWGWCYSWLSWCLGIAACRTRYALLHDLDALMLRRDILEQRYEAIRRMGSEFLGRSFYRGNGIDESDGLAVTFELMFDAQWVRRVFKPTDLFNHAGWLGARRVEFDTFLHAQSRKGRVATVPIDAEDLIHPSQVFCQYTELVSRWRYDVPAHNNLPMLPYLFHLGGSPETLEAETEALSQCNVGQAMLFGQAMDVSRLSHEHLDWLVTQVTRVECVVADGLRPEVSAYFTALRHLIPGKRHMTSANTPEAVGSEPKVDGNPEQTARRRSARPLAVVSVPPHEETSRTMNETPVVHERAQRAENEAGRESAPSVALESRQKPERVLIHGVAFDAIDEQACGRYVMAALEAGCGGWIITPNLDHVRRAQFDRSFQAMLREADLVVADGMPLIWAARLQGTPLPERVAGSSLVLTLAAAAAKQGRSLFLLGGEPGAADAAARVLKQCEPALCIAGTCCPPIGFESDCEQMRAVRAAVREARPDIVYVALGSPKQERLIRELRGELPEAWWIGVGISLSYLCGWVRRAPPWVQRMGLEWLHRLVQEPRRLARRYLAEGLPFAARLLTCALVKRMRGSERAVTPKYDVTARGRSLSEP